MTTRNNTTDAPARALDAVCKATDSLADVKRRLDTAISALDDAVPHPADEQRTADQHDVAYARLMELQIQLEEPK